MNTNFTVGQVVMFGRPNGEKTRGKIVDINMKTVTVVTTEDRGKTKAGVKWRVAPSFITPIDASSVLPSASSNTVANSAVDRYVKSVLNAIPHIRMGEYAELEKMLRDAYLAGRNSR